MLDFGCGEGEEAIELAQAGAKKVIGIDIRPAIVERAREKAVQAGVSHLCCFWTHTDERVDAVTSGEDGAGRSAATLGERTEEQVGADIPSPVLNRGQGQLLRLWPVVRNILKVFGIGADFLKQSPPRCETCERILKPKRS